MFDIDLLIIPLIIDYKIIHYLKVNRLSKNKYKMIAKNSLIIFSTKNCFKGFLIINLNIKGLGILHSPGFFFIN